MKRLKNCHHYLLCVQFCFYISTSKNIAALFMETLLLHLGNDATPGTKIRVSQHQIRKNSNFQ